MSGKSTPTVSYPYVRNMAGMEVDEESMKMVPHAKAELYCHVTTKFAEAGAIIGGLVGGGLGAVRPNLVASRAFFNGARNGMLIGMPIGIFATYMRMRSVQKGGDVDMDYAYFDRSYRLRNNRGQVRVDRGAYCGMVVGTVTAAVYGAPVLGGAAAGLAAGTVAGSLYNVGASK